MPLLRRVLLGAVLAVLGVVATPPVSPVSAGERPPVRPEEGQIARLYASALGRTPETDGYHYWVNRLVEGQTLSSVAGFFVTSEEFTRRFEAGTDQSFLDVVYRNVLGRLPDVQGRQYWLGRLASGLTRERLVLHFSESDEFIETTGTGLPALPPFEFTIDFVSVEELGVSWRDGCPVGADSLRLLTVTYAGFDGSAHTGRLVVHRAVAEDVAGVFAELYDARYPIERMQTVDQFGGDDNASMEANNTSAFNCRSVTNGSAWSNHAYGQAIDINPRFNPYQRGPTVLPPDGEQFLDRSRYHPAFIREGDIVTRAFDEIGWQWGGRWTSLVDYQHFDLP